MKQVEYYLYNDTGFGKMQGKKSKIASQGLIVWSLIMG